MDQSILKGINFSLRQNFKILKKKKKKERIYQIFFFFIKKF
jgi:hypothetical protein